MRSGAEGAGRYLCDGNNAPRALLAVCLVLAVLPVHEALAAPGLGAPVQIAPHGDCVSLAGDLIAWSNRQHVGHLRQGDSTDYLAELGASGPSAQTTLGSRSAFAGCPAPVSAGAGGAVVETVSEHPFMSWSDVRNEPLYFTQPGAAPRALGLLGIEPSLALAPDGSGVIAWNSYVGKRRRDTHDSVLGSAFVVQAARISATGQLGATETLTAPSGGYSLEDETTGGPPGPVANIAADGAVTVAYSLLSSLSGSATVSERQAQPGQAFGVAQTFVAEASERATNPEDELQAASDAAGQRFLQWQIGPEFAIEAATQGSLLEPFTVVADPLPLATGPGALLDTQMSESGETLTLQYSPSGISEAPRGELAVVRRAPGGGGQVLEHLVLPGANESIEDAQLALATDGTAAVTWVAALTGPGGGRTSRVMLATAPPGGPFGPAVAVTGLAPTASDSAVAFDPSGSLRLAWTTSEGIARPGPLFAAVGEPQAADPLEAAGPLVKLHARPRQQVRKGLFVTVHVDGPCLVRLELVGGRSARGVAAFGEALDALHSFSAAGSARLRIPEVPSSYVHGKHAQASVVAYASGSDGASSSTTLRVRVRRARPGRERWSVSR
jgi:hypothetical protein